MAYRYLGWVSDTHADPCFVALGLVEGRGPEEGRGQGFGGNLIGRVVAEVPDRVGAAGQEALMGQGVERRIRLVAVADSPDGSSVYTYGLVF